DQPCYIHCWLFFHASVVLRDLQSFPTRRSSDLNERIAVIGQTVFGFGALFFGLELMSGGMAPLSSLDIFHDLTVNMSDNPILGVAIGTVFTLVVQSSSATIGILQGLYAEQ